ncbi:helix-turn-helix domain-containing protein [Vibrio sp. S12_S33]|uniref:helix-turn-helix domain-containing protein n=1 Tax=Vibrio sp. S12_S33 TaxID=2720223 RepID=UPI00178369F3|nr:helix-turn-helix transcriptional regulator [Vibrio sp. S12_S33]MBD1564466.1 helix-turn-helix transcriptional regulator [Vibrio sp. S12_S33]
MNSIENELMLDPKQIQRFKSAILKRGTYEEVSELTEISVSTLKRICAGKTDPKLSDVIKIAKITNENLNDLVYGETREQQIEAVKSFVSALNGIDEKTDEAYRTIIWQLSGLYKEDIQAISTQVQALKSHREKQRASERATLRSAYIRHLIDEQADAANNIKQELIESYGFSEEELSGAEIEYEVIAEKKKAEREKRKRLDETDKINKAFGWGKHRKADNNG